MSEIPGFMTPTEAAAAIGVSHAQVTRYVADERLPCKRIGRQILIPTDAVAAFERPAVGNPNFQKKGANGIA